MFNLDERINYYFNEIAKIPHGSKNELAISKYIIGVAKDLGLEYKTDEMHNVIVFKPASKGYEKSDAIILQAHQDMVTEKDSDKEFNFETDSLELRVIDGYLWANGTTLGADDGSGVCYMLAVLSDKKLEHPSLECIFTVQEEIGLFGADFIKVEDIKANKLISLDGDNGFETSISSAGGSTILLNKNLNLKENNDPTYKISVGGLLGGHSGGEIDKERANAIKCIARMLNELRKSADVQLCSLEGGSKDNVIPSYASTTFTTKMNKLDVLNGFTKVLNDVKEEYKFSDSNIVFEFEELISSEKCASVDISNQIISFLFTIPNGLLMKNRKINDMPLTSCNIGVAYTKNGILYLEESIRSNIDSSLDLVIDQFELLADVFAFNLELDGRYPAWPYSEVSELRNVMAECTMDLYQTKLKEVASHGGLECGIFKNLNPKFDIVCFGPLAYDIHSSKERLNLQSYHDCYELLIEMLKRSK